MKTTNWRNPIFHTKWENALTLARMHRWMRSDFLRNWGAISPDGRRPEGGIALQFRRKRTAFTDASEPESTHSHCYIEKIWCTIVKHFWIFTIVIRTHNFIFNGKFRPVLIGQTIYSRVHMGLSWWVESIGAIKKNLVSTEGALTNAPSLLT